MRKADGNVNCYARNLKILNMVFYFHWHTNGNEYKIYFRPRVFAFSFNEKTVLDFHFFTS